MVTDAPVKHFLADIDGTTFPDRQNGESLPDGFYGALARLSRIIERGNKGDLPPFGFCTGRELTYVQVITRALPLPDGWSIIENGLCLYNLATEERINHPLFTQKLRLPSEISGIESGLLPTAFPIWRYTSKKRCM